MFKDWKIISNVMYILTVISLLYRSIKYPDDFALCVATMILLWVGYIIIIRMMNIFK